MISKKRAAVSSHVGRAAARTCGRRPINALKSRVAGEQLDGITERGHVADGHEHAVLAVIGEERQVCRRASRSTGRPAAIASPQTVP